MAVPSNSVSLVLKATGASGTKTWTIPNPVPKTSFSSDDADDFVQDFGALYNSDVDLVEAYYVTKTYEQVFPAP